MSSVAFSPDGRRVVSGGDFDSVRVWDWAAGTSQALFQGHDLYVDDVALSPDGQKVASVGDGGVVRIWDLAGGAASVMLGGADDPVVSDFTSVQMGGG